MNLFKKSAAVLGTAATSVLVFTAPAHAAVDAAVTTVLGEMKTDGVIVAGAVFVALIAIVAIKYLRKAM